jgi:hypothetical protein
LWYRFRCTVEKLGKLHSRRFSVLQIFTINSDCDGEKLVISKHFFWASPVGNQQATLEAQKKGGLF